LSQWIVDASLALGWFLEDEQDRQYSLSVLAGLENHDFVVPFLWHYEVANGLLMAHRRKRITTGQVAEFLDLLKIMRVQIDRTGPEAVLDLANLGLRHDLTVYDAAYLELALRLQLPIATQDKALRRAMEKSGVSLVSP